MKFKKSDDLMLLRLLSSKRMAQSIIPFLFLLLNTHFLYSITLSNSDLKHNKSEHFLELPVFIEGKGKIPAQILIDAILYNNKNIDVLHVKLIIEHYIIEADAEKINYDVAVSQMILETGYLQFGGLVEPRQNNFAGLGTTGPGFPGLFFQTIQDGVRAHVQHLKAYGSEDELESECIDPRFKYVKRGSARTIFDLTGKWATDPGYGMKLYQIIKKLYTLYYIDFIIHNNLFNGFY